jgi:hypothetical protein
VLNRDDLDVVGILLTENQAIRKPSDSCPSERAKFDGMGFGVVAEPFECILDSTLEPNCRVQNADEKPLICLFQFLERELVKTSP